MQLIAYPATPSAGFTGSAVVFAAASKRQDADVPDSFGPAMPGLVVWQLELTEITGPVPKYVSRFAC